MKKKTGCKILLTLDNEPAYPVGLESINIELLCSLHVLTSMIQPSNQWLTNSFKIFYTGSLNMKLKHILYSI